MSLPVMGLCPDSKRTLNFCNFMKKTPNSTMLDKGGVSVYTTTNGCTADPVNHKEPKFPPYFSQTTYNDKQRFIPSLRSVLVGGFLGSKSQVRSSHPQLFWDIVCTTVVPNLLGECIKHCDFSSAPSPPKKKFAKEMGLEKLAIVDTHEFPSVIDKQTTPISPVEGPKQSYAEVAKAPSTKPSRPITAFNLLSDPKDKTASRPRRRGNRHKSHSSDHKSRKRSSRHQASSDSLSSLTSESQTGDLKDLRLDQKEKHFSNLRTDHNNRNLIKSNRSKISEERENSLKEKQQSHCRPKRHIQSRSHCDKRSSKARSFNCDIDKINWRTGEPIANKMGSQHCMEMDCEELAGDQPNDESFSSEQNNDDCYGEPWKPAVSSPKVCSPPAYVHGGSPIRRLRRLSECSVDSEDSFIVFQTAASSDDSLSDLSSDYSDSDDTYESDSSEEDDVYDGHSPTSLRLKEVNDLWQRVYQLQADSFNALPGEGDEREKRVRFSDSKPTIHRMLAWDFAYRSARPGPWEQMVRDRDRFKTRIRLCESTISPVLNCDHRNKVWKKLHCEQR